MAEFTKKQYLDYAGLAKFWELISAKAVKSVSVDDKQAVFTAADGKTTLFTIGGATTEVAGLLTANDKKKLEAVSGNIEAAIDLKGIKVNGTAAATDTDKNVNINLVWNKNSKKIQLVDLNTIVEDKAAVLTEIDASDFVKDGMLSNAELVVNPDGETAGTYLKFTFNTEAGKQDVFVNVTSLIDVYTGGNGINVSGKVISVVTNDKYLTVDATGIKTTTQLVTDYTAAATTAAGEALESAKSYTNEEVAKLTNAENGLVAQAKSYTDQQIGLTNAEVAKKADKETVNGELAKKADKETTYTKIEVDNKVKAVDDKVAAIVGDGGTLASTLAAAKSYTDEEVAKHAKTVNDALAEKADKSTTYTKTEVDGILEDYSTSTEVTNEIAAAVAGVNATIGTVTEGKTVVEMISAAQEAAVAAGEAAAQAAYNAMERITEAEIAAIVSGNNQ